MPDLLVKLYDLPPVGHLLEKSRQQGVSIRRALAPELHVVSQFACEHFSEGWASEIAVGFSHVPPGVFVAEKAGQCVGFACYDATCRGFFGPVGVAESERGSGIGAALSLATLHAMREVGYGYAIIGAAGPIEFYRKLCGATPIPDSWPGIYHGLMKSR